MECGDLVPRKASRHLRSSIITPVLFPLMTTNGRPNVLDQPEGSGSADIAARAVSIQADNDNMHVEVCYQRPFINPEVSHPTNHVTVKYP